MSQYLVKSQAENVTHTFVIRVKISPKSGRVMRGRRSHSTVIAATTTGVKSCCSSYRTGATTHTAAGAHSVLPAATSATAVRRQVVLVVGIAYVIWRNVDHFVVRRNRQRGGIYEASLINRRSSRL